MIEKIIKIFLGLMFIMVIIFCIRACTFQKEIYLKGKISSVYMHEPGNYSVISIDQDGKLHNITFPWDCFVPITIYTDIPPTEDMWFETRYYENEWLGYVNTENSFTNIHIKSVRNINGGGWNHGKFGHGQTHIINN